MLASKQFFEKIVDSRRIRTALERLQLIGAAPLARHLLEDFRGNYGERHTLMEELQGLEA